MKFNTLSLCPHIGLTQGSLTRPSGHEFHNIDRGIYEHHNYALKV